MSPIPGTRVRVRGGYSTIAQDIDHNGLVPLALEDGSRDFVPESEVAPVNSTLQAAYTAHIRARSLWMRMQEAAAERDEAVAAAHAAGASLQDLAEVLGVNRQRVHQMVSKTD